MSDQVLLPVFLKLEGRRVLLVGGGGMAAAMLRAALPNLVVLSFQELSPDLDISPIGRIGWS